MGNLTISLKDKQGNVALTTVTVPNDKATLENALIVANYLKTWSAAAVVGYGASKRVIDDTATATDGKYDRCQQRLTLLYVDKEADESRRFSIPAPEEAYVDEDQEPTSALAKSVRDVLKDVGALVNNDAKIDYNGGGLNSRLKKKMGRKTKMDATLGPPAA